MATIFTSVPRISPARTTPTWTGECAVMVFNSDMHTCIFSFDRQTGKVCPLDAHGGSHRAHQVQQFISAIFRPTGAGVSGHRPTYSPRTAQPPDRPALSTNAIPTGPPPRLSIQKSALCPKINFKRPLAHFSFHVCPLYSSVYKTSYIASYGVLRLFLKSIWHSTSFSGIGCRVPPLIDCRLTKPRVSNTIRFPSLRVLLPPFADFALRRTAPQRATAIRTFPNTNLELLNHVHVLHM